ncbi:transketolase family protein [Candidatus Dojkabacteria bacterium]|nr:transketolase family protein [Candidatus Dojkabacteria bacterium]
MSNYFLRDWKNESKLEQKALRDGFGEMILKLGKDNKDIIVLNADLPGSLRVKKFEKELPNQFVQVGVAEQNMAGIATGLEIVGKIPFITSFAAFSPGLNFSQIRLAAICKQNIKVVGSHYGLNVGEDGASAQMNSDLGMMKSLAGITIITPADYNQAMQATKLISEMKGPAYLRVTRAKFPVFLKPDSEFEIGKAQKLIKGDDLTVIATGSMVYETIQALLPLIEDGLSIDLLNIHTVKPLDKEIILKSAKKTNKVIVVEEHNIWGGLGESVARLLGEKHPVEIKCIGIKDTFGESGSHRDLWSKYGLDRKSLRKQISSLIF